MFKSLKQNCIHIKYISLLLLKAVDFYNSPFLYHYFCLSDCL